MKLNIQLDGNTPEHIKTIIEAYLPERKVTIEKQYDNVSCDFDIQSESEGMLVCTLEALMEMTYAIKEWQIRFW